MYREQDPKTGELGPIKSLYDRWEEQGYNVFKDYPKAITEINTQFEQKEKPKGPW